MAKVLPFSFSFSFWFALSFSIMCLVALWRPISTSEICTKICHYDHCPMALTTITMIYCLELFLERLHFLIGYFYFTYIQFFVLFRLVRNANIYVHFVCWPRVHARDAKLVFLKLNLNYHLGVNFGINWPWNFRFIERQGLLSFSSI